MEQVIKWDESGKKPTVRGAYLVAVRIRVKGRTELYTMLCQLDADGKLYCIEYGPDEGEEVKDKIVAWVKLPEYEPKNKK